MNYYVFPSSPEEIAEYEHQEKERMNAYIKEFECRIEKVIKQEFERVGLISKAL